MRAGLLFGKLQGKKYVKMIPVILLESCLLAVLLFLFGSFASKAIYGDLKIREIKVGIVSEEDGTMTRMLVGFVESMDSFQGSCQFSLMEETEAERALEQGEIYAAIYLPAGVLESILSGENLPAKIVFGHAGSQMETAVFKEVAGAGNRLLSVAQAGIYAADELCINAGKTELISEVEDVLNQAYLDYALGRDAIFKLHEVTATGKVSLIAYYVMALFLIFLSFVGTIMSRKSVIEPSAHSDLLAVSGMGYMRQYMAEALAFSGVFALLGTVLGVPVLCLVMKIENWGIPGVIEIVTLLGVLLMLGAFVRLLSEITGKEAGGIGISLFVQFMMIFASGLLLPSAFLPARIEKAGRWMPYHLWMELLLSCVQKNSEGRGVLLLLICFAGCIFTGAVIFRRRKKFAEKKSLQDAERFEAEERRKERQTGKNRAGEERQIGKSQAEAGEETQNGKSRAEADKEEVERTGQQKRVKSKGLLFSVLLKQYLLKHRMWFFVLAAAAVFLLIAGTGRKEEELTGIQIGVYAEDADGKKLYEQLNEEEGIFRFTLFETSEEMQKQVESGILECGYVFPENFYENIKKGKMNRQIDLYYSPGSGVHKLSYEVVFSYLFASLSENILEEWLTESGLEGEAKEELLILKEKYETDGSTFSFQYEMQEEGDMVIEAAENSETAAVLDSTRGVIAVIIFFMCLLGLGNCCDIWEGAVMFSRSGKRRIRACSLHITVLGAVLSGLILLLVSGSFQWEQAGKEMVALLFYFLVLESYLWILRMLLRSSKRVYGMIPMLITACLLLSPVFIQIKTYIPAVAFLEIFFPTSWYLYLFM